MPGDTVFVDLALNGKEIDGGVVTAMDREDYETLVEPWAGAALSLKLDRSSTDPGTCQGSRYVQLGDNRLHRLIKRDELQEKEKEGGKHVVDHINGDTLDNRRSNLRVVNQGQNLSSPQRSKTTRRPTTSDMVGVDYDKINGCWRARIVKHNSLLHSATFQTEDDAKNWLTEMKAKHAKEIGMDAEPPERLERLAGAHERIDAWYVEHAIGESEESRQLRLGKKVEHNRGLKQDLQTKRARELAEVTEELKKDPTNVDLINKKSKLERAETFSHNRATGEKQSTEQSRKKFNETRNSRAAAERAKERAALESAEQTDEVKAALKKLDTKELLSKARLEGKQVDEKQKWRDKADAERRAAFDALMAREGSTELLRQYNIRLPVDRLDMVERAPYNSILGNVRGALGRHIKKNQRESDIALLEFIDEFEKIMMRENVSKAKLKKSSQTATESSYSAESDLANANREMDEFLAEHEALYGEYNGLCNTTRRDHVIINKSPRRLQTSMCAAKKRIEEMRENGDRPDLVRFMDEIEWCMNRIKQCESACHRL